MVGGESDKNKFGFGKLLNDTNKKLAAAVTTTTTSSSKTTTTTTKSTTNKSNNQTLSFDDTIDYISDTVHQRWDTFCSYLLQRYPSTTNPKINWMVVNFLQNLSIEAPISIGFAFTCILLHVLNITLLPGISIYLGTNSTGFNIINPLDYIRIVTHMFGHDGIIHLRNNMTHLLLVGPSAEASFGSKVIVQVMIISAIATSIAHMLVRNFQKQAKKEKGFLYFMVYS